jgi:hypothetical protein
MKQKSVVEWLVDKLFDPPTLLQEQIEWIEKAKEMEKEQMMNAYDIGWSNGNKGQDLNDLYYFETFNTEEK